MIDSDCPTLGLTVLFIDASKLMINKVFVQTSLVVVKTSERDFAASVALLELDQFYRPNLDLVLYGKGSPSTVPVGTGTQPLPSYYY